MKTIFAVVGRVIPNPPRWTSAFLRSRRVTDNAPYPRCRAHSLCGGRA